MGGEGREGTGEEGRGRGEKGQAVPHKLNS